MLGNLSVSGHGSSHASGGRCVVPLTDSRCFSVLSLRLDVYYFQLVICLLACETTIQESKGISSPLGHFLLTFFADYLCSSCGHFGWSKHQLMALVSLETGQLWLVPETCLWVKVRGTGTWPGFQLGCTLQSKFWRHDDGEVL